MRAFEIYLNDESLCLAGIGDDGVLTAIVSWVTGKKAADLFLQVGGLISPTDEHVSWIQQKRLRVGDQIRVKVVKVKSVDEPLRKYRRDPAKELRAKKNYVRTMAKELGWRIQEKSKKPAC